MNNKIKIKDHLILILPRPYVRLIWKILPLNMRKICFPKLSTFVEHQAFVLLASLPLVVQVLYVTLRNLKGNMQGLLGSGPLVVMQPKKQYWFLKK